MTRFKRRLIIATALFVLVALALAAFLHVPTRRALERAEAFQFRRIVAVPGNGTAWADRGMMASA